MRDNCFLAPGFLCALFLAVAVPVIMSGFNQGRGAADQNRFHLPVIHRFAEQWPHLDLRDYRSATTPGYHIALAAVARYVTDDLRGLQFAGALFTLALIAIFGAALAYRNSPWVAVTLALPVIFSIYVFSSAIWLLPDNAGWLGVLMVLLIALHPPKGWAFDVAAGIALFMLVLTRQAQIWTAGVLWIAAWIGSGTSNSDSGRATRMWRIASATVPAIALLLYFAHLWHGLVPPMFQPGGSNSVVNAGVSPAAPSFALALFGLYGLFFAGFATPRLIAIFRQGEGSNVIIAGALIGALSALVPATSYNYAQGRRTGIWNYVGRFPVIANRSMLITALATLGGATLAGWWLVLNRRDRLLVIPAFIFFAITQIANANVWQRYYEPLILILLALMASRVGNGPKHEHEPSTRRPKMATIGPLILSLLLAIVTIRFLHATDPHG